MQTIFTIDSTKAGNGDIWMRLVSFYAIADLCPQYRFCICIPAFLGPLATFAFGDRLLIITDRLTRAELTYTNLGIKDLFKPILGGQKFISPYQRSVILDKKQKAVKDYINTQIFNVADWLGMVQVPAEKFIPCYQGYLDIIGIKKIRHITYAQYTSQLRKHYNNMLEKFMGPIPVSDQLVIPPDLKDNILFFPTGTSRQFVPVWWAVEHLPNAYYAFYVKDPDAALFEEAGLKVVYFYREPGDIIKLAHAAKWTISTDSFPSHLLQYTTSRCTIALTEVLKSRIISPVYRGKVSDSLAACHPCLHLNRDEHTLCAAGHKECINWQKKSYTDNILHSVQQR